jgi:hypothetical protein
MEFSVNSAVLPSVYKTEYTISQAIPFTQRAAPTDIINLGSPPAGLINPA